MYGETQSEVISRTRFDENSDLSTPYLGRVDITRVSKIKVEERFSISEQGYTVGKPLDGAQHLTLLDTGARKSLMSMTHYLHCKPFICYQNLHLKHRIWKNGELSIMSISTSILGHESISSLKLNVSLYLYNISITFGLNITVSKQIFVISKVSKFCTNLSFNVNVL